MFNHIHRTVHVVNFSGCKFYLNELENKIHCVTHVKLTALMWVSESHSVVSDSLWPHGLYSPWNSPGQNTGVGSLSLLQGIFPTQGWSPGLPHCRWILNQLSPQSDPIALIHDSYSKWRYFLCSPCFPLLSLEAFGDLRGPSVDTKSLACISDSNRAGTAAGLHTYVHLPPGLWAPPWMQGTVRHSSPTSLSYGTWGGYPGTSFEQRRI